MSTYSPPLQPSLVLTTPTSPPSVSSPNSTTQTPRRQLRNSSSYTQLNPISTSTPSSRSPSPSPSGRRLSSSSSNSTSNGLSALAAAGLGLLSLPPSPSPEVHGFDFARNGLDDEQEELATPPRGRTNLAGEQRKSSLGFLEPDKDTKEKERGRSRKMSFGLGFEGRMRRLSFGGSGGTSSIANTVESPVDASAESPSSGQQQQQQQNSRKANKPKNLIRRAKSFGTSPLLGGTASTSGSFASQASIAPSTSSAAPIDHDLSPPIPISSSPYSSSPSNSPNPAHPSLPKLTTSSLSLASSSHSTAASPNSSTPATPLSAPPSSSYVPLTVTSARMRQPSLSRQSEEDEVISPSQSQPHWLLAPMVPAPRPGSDSMNGKGKRRESEERATGLGFIDSETRRESKDSGKEKKKTSAIRRATLSVFGRRDTSNSTTAKSQNEDPRRNSVDPPTPHDSPFMTDSPNESPAPSRKNSSSTGLPSLPSLPSLQLSSNPYRMSWAFGNGSPTSSPAPSPARRRSNAPSPRSGSPAPIPIPNSSRPSLSISPVPSPRPASSQSSPISAHTSSVSSISPTKSRQHDQLPIPPALTHTLSTDSAKTLLVTLPAQSSTTASPSSPVTRLGRAHSTSSPPLLRRTASYAPSTSPHPSSPLASPPLPLPSTSEPSHLDRRRTLTRASRSHSDASDRRSPSITTPPIPTPSSFIYGGGRGSVTGGLGAPPGGGYFASAHYRAGGSSSMPRRPGTADSPPSTRTSVFGFGGSGWSGLFGSSNSSNASSSTNQVNASTGGSVGMSRSSSAATSTPSTPGATGTEINEFGALFDGNTGGGKLSRPGTGRKRGLSVGNGFFGSNSNSNSVSAANREKEEGRARSGSGSSATSDSPMRAPSVLGRMRASTDPNKRLSLGSNSLGGLASNSSNTSLGPPTQGTGINSRPATSEGVASLFGGGGGNGNRKRGSSLSIVSPSQSMTSSPTAIPGFRPEPKPVKKFPTPRIESGETPEEFVRRLLEGDDDSGEGRVGKGEVSKVLAASAEEFYAQALAAYLRLFPFESLALDIALRLFLCSSSLPPETQQIDRVMEAFARRWCECNPELFAVSSNDVPKDGDEGVTNVRKQNSEESDIPYVLAFSMVMLNTDAFNPNAKGKMTKADYIKNTRIDGVAVELLEYLYDQITLAPFIFVEGDNPASAFFNPSPTFLSTSTRADSVSPGGALSVSNAGSGFFGGNSQKAKIDPYHFIATGQTSRFRVDVESHIPFKSPFSYTGTTAFLNATSLHHLFARAPILQTSNRPRASSRSQTSSHIDSTASSIPPTSTDALEGSPLAQTVSSSTFVANPPKDKEKSSGSSLKITKVGVLSRKEDLGEGGKKAASRKWKAWSVVLTGSQLLFFKDSHFAQILQQTLDAATTSTQPRPDDNHVLVFTLQSPFKPDAVLSLSHTAALYDTTYRRHPNVFRLVAPAGRQYLFQAHNAEDLNSWLHAINYAASFKSANVRIRPLQPPTLRSSTTSPVPASPAMSASSTQSINSPPRMAWGSTVGSLASNATSIETESRKGSVAMDFREDSAATVRPNFSPAPTGSATGAAGDASFPPDLQEALESGRSDSVPSASSAKPLPNLPQTPFPPPLVPIVNTRADILRTRIGNLDEAISQARTLVQNDLRLAKHLSILTPFRSSTREKVLTAIPPIEKRVRQARMNLVKLICYREVLSRDLLVEDRETERFTRKRSLHRSHSRKISTTTRSPSPPPLISHSHPARHHGSIAHWSSPLSQSHSSLAVPPLLGDGTMSGRESFESAADSLPNETGYSFTDDELDRLQPRSPPPMQRSRTEQDWSATMEYLRFETSHRGEEDFELAPPILSASGKSPTDDLSTKGLSPTPSTVSLAPLTPP